MQHKLSTTTTSVKWCYWTSHDPLSLRIHISGWRGMWLLGSAILNPLCFTPRSSRRFRALRPRWAPATPTPPSSWQTRPSRSRTRCFFTLIMNELAFKTWQRITRALAAAGQQTRILWREGHSRGAQEVRWESRRGRFLHVSDVLSGRRWTAGEDQTGEIRHWCRQTRSLKFAKTTNNKIRIKSLNSPGCVSGLQERRSAHRRTEEVFDRDASAHDRRASGETQTGDRRDRPTVHDPAETTLQLLEEMTDPSVHTDQPQRNELINLTPTVWWINRHRCCKWHVYCTTDSVNIRLCKRFIWKHIHIWQRVCVNV